MPMQEQKALAPFYLGICFNVIILIFSLKETQAYFQKKKNLADTLLLYIIPHFA